MKAENIITEPIKMTYKVGVYSAMTFVGVFLAAFVSWSFCCAGGAIIEGLGKLI
ncbi:hypothetical protein [Desulfuromonas sp. AOP6]|uniref:hypothetical protein n=1 Tax=Desulfuromonas sp. AOP6 TaxID=1566351 RepID=UPI001270C4E5|nr:hypothetical protein [Desulfuromonas sp. AOP6]BCA78334.1 hypothetical protein AOP6_0121 [Desulfuromonas sp. AOP6]